MIKNIYSMKPNPVSNCHDGEGTISVVDIFDGFTTKMQFFHHTVLPPGTTIGSHKHGNDEEFYVVLEGSGEMELDGSKQLVSAGDVIMNKPYGTHGLRNTSTTDELKILVFGVNP